MDKSKKPVKNQKLITGKPEAVKPETEKKTRRGKKETLLYAIEKAYKARVPETVWDQVFPEIQKNLETLHTAMQNMRKSKSISRITKNKSVEDIEEMIKGLTAKVNRMKAKPAK